MDDLFGGYAEPLAHVVKKLPSQHLDDLLSGKVAYADTPPAIQSWAALSIYEGAVSLLRIKNKDARNAALLKVPETLRARVKDEVVRLWGLRVAK